MTSSMKVFAVIAAVILAGAVVTYVLFPDLLREGTWEDVVPWAERHRKGETPEAAGGGSSRDQLWEQVRPKGDKEVIGKAGAPVEIVGFIPDSSCHAKVLRVARDFAENNPDKARLVLYRLHPDDEEVEKEKEKRGVTCAGFFINGSNTVTLTDARGKEEEVLLEKSPGTNYTEREFAKALRQAIAEAEKGA